LKIEPTPRDPAQEKWKIRAEDQWVSEKCRIEPTAPEI